MSLLGFIENWRVWAMFVAGCLAGHFGIAGSVGWKLYGAWYRVEEWVFQRLRLR